jgi:hypothetical protein
MKIIHGVIPEVIVRERRWHERALMTEQPAALERAGLAAPREDPGRVSRAPQ